MDVLNHLMRVPAGVSLAEGGVGKTTGQKIYAK